MRNKKQFQDIGKERIVTLFHEASEAFSRDPRRSHRYVTLALRIAAKTGVSIPRTFRRKYCKPCKRYLVSGINARIRTREGKLIIHCFHCKRYRRILLRSRTSKN